MKASPFSVSFFFCVLKLRGREISMMELENSSVMTVSNSGSGEGSVSSSSQLQLPAPPPQPPPPNPVVKKKRNLPGTPGKSNWSFCCPLLVLVIEWGYV